jgi:hypothetical protein
MLNGLTPIVPSTQDPSLVVVSSGAVTSTTTTTPMIPPVLNPSGVNSVPLMVQQPPLLLSHPNPMLLAGPPGSQPLLIQAPPGAYPQHSMVLATDSTAAPPSETPLSRPTFSSLPPTSSSPSAGLIPSSVGAVDQAFVPPPSGAILVPSPAVGPTHVSQQTEIMSQHARNLHESYMSVIRSINHHESGTPVASTTTKEQQPPPVGVFVNSVQARPTGAGTLGGQVQSENPPLLGVSPTNVDPNDIPDLLRGFDRVANIDVGGGYQSHHHAPTVAMTSASLSSQQEQLEHLYSPPFTSRSFDDFHRFLGNLSPLASERNAVSVSGSHAMLFPPHAPDLTSQNYLTPDGAMQVVATSSEPMALYHPPQPTPTPPEGVDATCEDPTTKSDAPLAAGAADRSAADVYNIFAQQSAFAASQHSAYTPQWLNYSNNENDTLSTKGGGMSGSSQNTKAISGAPLRKPLFTPDHRQHHPHPGTTTSSVISDFSSAMKSGQLLPARGTSNVVSEPSNTSDGGTDDTEDSPAGSSGSDSGEGDNDNSNDSDGAPSDTSGRRKKRRMSYSKSSLTTTGTSSRMSAASAADGNWDGEN